MHANDVWTHVTLRSFGYVHPYCMYCNPQKINGEAEVSCLEEQLQSKCEAFAALRKENMEYEQSIEDYKMKILER